MQEDFDKIKQFLDEKKVAYRLLIHEPVFTSEQAARVRGADLKEGAKSMIIRSEGKFSNFVLSAAKKLDWSRVKLILKTKSASLATAEEVLQAIHCEIGSVPPFGNLYGLKVYCDSSLLQNEFIEFNVGLHTHSIRMKAADWQRVVRSEVAEFAL